MWLWLSIAGCTGADEAPTAGQLDPVDRLVRASVAIRGIRPAVDEIEAVRADPGALPAMVAAYLEDPRLADTVRDMWAEVLLLRNDTFNQLPALGALEGYRLNEIYQGTVEEPLQFVAHVVTQDLPLTELVTADWMLTDDVTARIYGVPYDFDAGGWQISAWPDDRPLAGLLSSAQIWRRWESDGSNFNRGRANMVASRLLCEDFAARDILVTGGIDVADEFEVANAGRTNPSCVSCHQALDPLAGYFWGYKRLIHRNYVADSITHGCEFDWSENVPEFGVSYLPEDYCYPIRQYNPADEDDWADWDLRPPSYYGEPVPDLAALGQRIAEDPRFSQCMARRFAGWLHQVDALDVPFDRAAEWQGVLERTGFDTKALITAVVLDEAFARAGRPDGEALGGRLVMRPEQYARAVEDLTGFRWWSQADPPSCADRSRSDVRRFGPLCWGDVDLSDSDVFGFRSMAGGVDGKVILEPTRTMTPTRTMVIAELAANAAGYVVERDLAAPPEARKLLRLVEADTADEGRIRAQLAWLHLRILAEEVAPMGLEVDADLALYRMGGWELVLTALLQDPRMVLY